MSEEVVRQTRSQKRTLDREVTSTESSNSDNEHKKAKLNLLEPTSPTQTQPNNSEPKNSLSEKEQHQDIPTETSLSLVLPLDSQHTKNEQTQPSQRPKGETSSDNQAECMDSQSKGRRESTTDVMTQVRQMEPKVSGAMLVADEVEATIKVEVQADQPVDMTTCKSIKREKLPSSPEDDDVIIVSDNDSPSPPVNGLNHLIELDTELLMKSSAKERGRIIKQLKEELRLEEAKLVLLKKLRQSQIHKDAIQKASGLTGSSAPPPLIRGTTSGSRGSQQQIQALRHQQQQQHIAAGNSGSGPPPLLLGPKTPTPTSHGQRGLLQSGLIRVGNNVNALGSSMMKGSPSGTGFSVISINDSPASRQAAAKLALRKQLEKTLMEIPPPKPPAPEFNFLPSAANNEFIYLVGLEEVVHNLLETFHKGKTALMFARPIVQDPFICTQCKTDFTCRWRQDKAKGGRVFCEDCMSSNLKKALKAEHTNRLKAAFVKALQQEQEIDQCINQASSIVSHSSSSASLKAEHLVSQQLKQAQGRMSSLQHHHQSSRGVNLIHHHAIKQSSHGKLSHGSVSSVSVRGIPHPFSSSQLQSAVAAAALVSRPGKQSQVSRQSVQSTKVSSSGISGGKYFSDCSASSTAWKKQSNSSKGVTMAYVNPSLTGHKTSASVDARQREYLLDMIPSRSSISPITNTWK